MSASQSLMKDQPHFIVTQTKSFIPLPPPAINNNVPKVVANYVTYVLYFPAGILIIADLYLSHLS